MKYTKKGMVQEQVGAIILLIMGVGVATLVLIFVGVLGGQVYSQVQGDIASITDTNIKGNITAGITSGFKALNLTGSYLPIVVLAVIIFIVLGLVMSLGRPTAYAGGAL
jgi:hypothetical protein